VAPAIKSVDLSTKVKLPYAEQGDSSGIPILLLHGYVDSWRAFEGVLPHLPESIRAFALSQRGHGDADRPTSGYRPHDFAADLEAFMDALRLEAAVIVGASSGGITAQRFAIDHPKRTLGLVLAGSPITLRGNQAVLEFWEYVSELKDPIDPGFVREFHESTLVQQVPQTFLDTLIEESLKVPARLWKAALEPLLDADFSEELDKIEAPTLIAWGDKDAFLPRRQQEALAAAIPRSQLIVYPGAGHAFYWEEPARFAADLTAFATRLAW
jgi:non-heme chloroperoxidase